MRPQARRMSDNPGNLAGYIPLFVALTLIGAMVMFVPSEVVDGPAAGLRASGVTRAQAKTASGWNAGVEPCEDRELQVPDSGYSPPCLTWSGDDNGGATAVGVTEDTIRISHRHIADGHMPQTLSELAGMSLGEDAEDMWISTEGLVAWFNEHFEFYGRELELVKYDGKGSLTTELFGGGQENANVDARQVVDLEVFADATSFTQPYSEALVDQEVISIGAPYMSREWFKERYPYAWSNFPDCSSVSEMSVEVAVERFLGEPAEFAGGELADRRRTIAIIHPDTKEYTDCARAGARKITEAGYEVDVQSYPFQLGASAAQATGILAKLRNDKVTTVACGCDPLMVMSLTQQAEQQEYYPEWYLLSTGFVDWDLTGQIIANGSGSQWSRALGITPTAPPVPFGESEAYRAFKSARPDLEPSQFVDVGFSMLYRLAIGIQMAGPDLNPETFGQGMFNYPGGNGPLGAWKFSPDNPSGAADSRLVYWGHDQPSPFNEEPGTYITVGERFTEPADAPAKEELAEAVGALP